MNRKKSYQNRYRPENEVEPMKQEYLIGEDELELMEELEKKASEQRLPVNRFEEKHKNKIAQEKNKFSKRGKEVVRLQEQYVEKFGTYRRDTSKKEVLIDIIIDGTYSFTKVFPRVYYTIDRIIKVIGQEIKEYSGAVIKYGLTVLHDGDGNQEKAQPQKFKNGEWFSEDGEEVLQKIRAISFYGGSESGREDLKEGLDTALRVLNNSGNEKTNRGVLMFSDSIPKEQDLHPDFLDFNQNAYCNKGLRFAVFYTYNNKFTPKLKIVDNKGYEVENGRNRASFHSIEELLSSENECLEEIQNLVKNILQQISIL